MHHVIDTNSLHAPWTVDFLKDKANHVLLPVEVLKETLAHGTIGQYLEQMEILMRNADRVIMLKPLGEAMRISCNEENIANALIDVSQTLAFRSNAKEILLNGAHREAVLANIVETKRDSAKLRERRLLGAEETGKRDLESIRSAFDAKEFRLIKSGKPLKGSVSQKMYELAGDLTAKIIDATGFYQEDPKSKTAYFNFFIYRWALTKTNHLVHLLGQGNAPRKPKDYINDAIDVIVSTYATYFNGIITDDKVTAHIHILTRAAFGGNGGDVPMTEWRDVVVDHRARH